MNDRIKEKLKVLTTKPGVYIMRDKDGNVIYVGKAKNLKNRVSQYFRNSPKQAKVQAMVDNVDIFDYYITMSEMDALALESNLIKKYQPFYNILLKVTSHINILRSIDVHSSMLLSISETSL